MESEIFGHVKGSFTGAVNDRDGAAQRANGGTLFLDEICEMDLDLQTKLLRFVQTGSFQKVGGGTVEAVDIRFVCATNRDPNIEVAEGRFREDLFYRLHVIPMTLPPLRERGDDVLAIANHFLKAYSYEEGKSFSQFSPRAEAVFNSYSWPGNIRQLQNAVRNIVVLNDGEDVQSAMLPAPLNELAENIVEATVESSMNTQPVENPVEGQFIPTDEESIRPLDEVERQIIEQAIRLCDDNVPKAAARLGVSASTLYRKRSAWEEI
jgi:two-component system, repressor protein LuxO